MTRLVRCGAIAVFFAMPAYVRAQEAVNAENVAAAKALFEEGQKLMDEKRYPEACAKFQASQRNLPKVGTLLNLADCFEKNNQTASAWATYGNAIALGRKQNRPEYEDFAKKKAAELEGRLVRLTIIVPPSVRVPGMKIERDGLRVEEGEWGTDVPVDPGKHHIVVTAPKKLKWQTEVEVAADKSLSVNVPPLEDAPQAWPSVQQPEVVEKVVVKPSPWTPLRIAGIGVGALGLGGIVSGAILGVAAKSTYDGAFAKCGMMATNCPPDAVGDGRTAHTMADAATALFIVGAIATAGGVTLFLLGAPQEPRAEVSLGVGSIRLGGSF
jgi:hypothetical protein